MAATKYGDISPRTAAFVSKELLTRALPFLVFEKFGQVKPIPANNSQTIKFRRYLPLSNTPNTLTEGVTPEAKQLTSQDIQATLVQYGDRVQLTDVVLDTHEDPVLREATTILGEQAAQMMEIVRFNILKAGTSVRYNNGSARNAVNTALTLDTIRRAVRDLKRNNAKQITQVLRSTAAFSSENVAPSFVAIIHPDLERDIRDISGFTPSERYGSLSPWENELGKVEEVRFITSTIITPWADAGGAKGSMISTTGTSADVYPVILLARDAYGLVPLRGKTAITPMVVNPTPSDSDPLAQRAHVGWKTWQTAIILQDLFMVRIEVAATA
jgi:N4-gp56 family major capsid protein